jgi:hypothetical protein
MSAPGGRPIACGDVFLVNSKPTAPSGQNGHEANRGFVLARKSEDESSLPDPAAPPSRYWWDENQLDGFTSCIGLGGSELADRGGPSFV